MQMTPKPAKCVFICLCLKASLLSSRAICFTCFKQLSTPSSCHGMQPRRPLLALARRPARLHRLEPLVQALRKGPRAPPVRPARLRNARAHARRRPTPRCHQLALAQALVLSQGRAGALPRGRLRRPARRAQRKHRMWLLRLCMRPRRRPPDVSLCRSFMRRRHRRLCAGSRGMRQRRRRRRLVCLRSMQRHPRRSMPS